LKRKRKRHTPEEAIAEIARRNGVSVEEVRREIAQAIRAGMASAAPEARAFWGRFSKAGGLPEPEAVIASLARKVKKSGGRGP